MADPNYVQTLGVGLPPEQPPFQSTAAEL